MNTDQNTPLPWWEENWIALEMIVGACVTVWLSFFGLTQGAEVMKVWQSCTASSGVDCTPWEAIGFAVAIFAAIGILSYKQRMLMRFVGAMFFGLFLACFWGILGLLASLYPWWIHATALVVGVIGASILLPDDKLDEILEGRTKKPTILHEILEC